MIEILVCENLPGETLVTVVRIGSFDDYVSVVERIADEERMALAAGIPLRAVTILPVRDDSCSRFTSDSFLVQHG